jgi:hypothetical protein
MIFVSVSVVLAALPPTGNNQSAANPAIKAASSSASGIAEAQPVRLTTKAAAAEPSRIAASRPIPS